MTGSFRAGLLAALAALVLPAGIPATARDTTATGVQLITLGTAGGSAVRLRRAEPASVILVNGAAYLIDVGDGTSHALYAAGIKLEQVRALFITLHSQDRTSGLGPLLSTRWATSNKAPLTVYAPAGLNAILGGLRATLGPVAAYSAGGSGKPLSNLGAQEVTAPGLVYQDENVKVTALALPRRGVTTGTPTAFAYRFETAEGAIVFAGPTGPFDGLADFARGAKLLVCEVINLDAASGKAPQSRTSAGPAPIRPRLDHLEADDIGRLAAAANVGRVVLHHLIPGADSEDARTSERLYARDARTAYHGIVLIAHDGETFRLTTANH